MVVYQKILFCVSSRKLDIFEKCVLYKSCRVKTDSYAKVYHTIGLTSDMRDF